MSFFSLLEARVAAANTLLCVGLDPHRSELSVSAEATDQEVADAAFTFCKTLIDKTHEAAACYKPNAAFFEALGAPGHATLHAVIRAVPATIPVLLDCKRGDIGSTAEAYAIASYDKLDAHGVTLSPLMGYDSVAPFITGNYAERGGAFLLCKTSNPGSEDLLKANFENIARLATKWSKQASSSPSAPPSLGLVVGATDSEALARSRAAAPDLWILAPGVGFQGGDLDAACSAGMDASGSKLLLPVSRGISRAEDPKAAAEKLRDQINEVRETVKEAAAAAPTTIKSFQTDFISFALSVEVLKFGTFTLKSGRISPYFFNAGLFADGQSLSKLGRSYAASIMASKLANSDGTVKFDVIFGPAYKGISLGAVVASSLYDVFGVDVGFAYNRKEAKDHGEGGMLVGAPMDGKKVLVVDDVISAGTAIRESHEMLVKINAVPVGVSIALDRAEKRSLEDPMSAVQAVARDLGIPVVSIVGLEQLFGFLKGNADFDKNILEDVENYRKEYGVQ